MEKGGLNRERHQAREKLNRHKRKTSKFIFLRKGYATVYGVYIDGSPDRAEQISSHHYDYPFDERNSGFIVTAPVSRVSPTNGVFVIGMRQN